MPLAHTPPKTLSGRPAILLVLAVVGFLALTRVSAAADYYVAPNGSDSSPGTRSMPFRTIQKAASLAQAGDVIYVSAGTYTESVTITRSGELGAPITFQALGDGPVWIDGECARPNVISIEGDFITLKGMGVRRASEANIVLDGADHVTLDGMIIQDWNCAGVEDQYRAGVASWGGGSSLTITNSRFERRADLPGEDYGYGNAIWLKNVGPMTGGGHLISGNTIVGGFDGIGGEPEDVSWGGFYRDSVIENNTISDCADDGIQVEGGTANVMVRGNDIKRCLIGIAFAPALTGPLTILRNVVREPVERFGLGAAMLKAGDSSLGEVRVYHNSFFAGAGVADGLKQTNADLRNIHLRNNAIYAGRYVIETGSYTGPVTANFDAFFTTDGGRFVKWDGTRYSSIAELRTGTGQEMNGVSPSDFGWDALLRPLPGSPLIDAGIIIPGVNDDYLGAAPDIGAFEFGAVSTPTAAASPTPTPTPTLTPTPTPTPRSTFTPGPSSTPVVTTTPWPPTAPATTSAPTPGTSTKTPTPTASTRTTPTPVRSTPTPTPTPTPLPDWRPPTVTPGGPGGTVGSSPVPTPTRVVTPRPTRPPGPKWTPVPSLPAQVGDANCDGVVDVRDALIVLRAVARLSSWPSCASPVDGDCDNAVTAADAMLILKYVAGLRLTVTADCAALGSTS